jgi:uncharacterized protein (TIRG00374 family)
MDKSRKPSSVAGYIGLLVGIVLLGLFFWQIDLRESLDLAAGIGVMSLWILVPYGLLHLFETLGWARLFPLRGSKVSLRRLFSVQLITETVSMTVPAGVAVGEPMRPYLCRKYLAVPYPAGVASVAVRKLVLGLSQGIYSLVAAVWGFSFLQDVSNGLIGMGGLGWIVCIASVMIILLFTFLLLLLMNGSAAMGLHRLLVELPWKKVADWLLEKERSFHETDRELARLKGEGGKQLFVAVCFYTMSWMMLPLEAWLIIRLLGEQVGFQEMYALDTALTLMRSIVFFIPSGLGIQDFGYLVFFKALGLNDYLLVGGAFVLLRRLKELLWYGTGYILLFLNGIQPFRSLSEAER